MGGGKFQIFKIKILNIFRNEYAIFSNKCALLLKSEEKA